MVFFTRQLVGNAPTSTRQTTKHEEYVMHVYLQGSGLAGVVIADEEYPERAAHSLIHKMLDAFTDEFKESWRENTKDNSMDFSGWLRNALKMYADPGEADKLQKIDEELRKTTKIMHQVLEKAISRGEKLEDLAAKSSDLSDRSKMFLKNAKKANRCCSIQ